MVVEIYSAITGVAGALKSATEITKTLLETHDAGVVRAKVIELNGQILSAQQSALAAQADQFDLSERVRVLEKEIANLEAWETEKRRYELICVGPGGYAYSIKPDAQGAEPPHKICANCYQSRRKSLLHQETLSPGRAVILGCHSCGAVTYIQGASMKEHAARISAYRPQK